MKIDDFESASPLEDWTIIDTLNQTQPKIENPLLTALTLLS